MALGPSLPRPQISVHHAENYGGENCTAGQRHRCSFLGAKRELPSDSVSFRKPKLLLCERLSFQRAFFSAGHGESCLPLSS